MVSSRFNHRSHLALLLSVLLCCFAVASVASPIQHSSPQLLRHLQDTNEAAAAAADETLADKEDEAAVMQDDNLEQEYQYDDASLIEDHFDSKDFPPADTAATNNNNAPDAEIVEKVPEVVYDDVDMVAPEEKDEDDFEYSVPEDDLLMLNPEGASKEEKADEVVYDTFGVSSTVDEIASDGNDKVEEVDVEEGAIELIQEAEEEEEETNVKGNNNIDAVPLKTYPTDKQMKWIAHGSIGAVIFGILVPSAISSAFFRDLIPGYWIYVHVILNVTTFALTFFTVGIAFATMNGMGDASEGHMKEVHHIVGLLLLLLVSFQTANGFLRPPREFITDDEDDRTPGAIHRSNSKSLTTRTIWFLTHAGCGLLIFVLGTYQVHSGMELFSRRYGTTNWGSVYLGYIFLVVIAISGGKMCLKWKSRKARQLSFDMHPGGEFNYGGDDLHLSPSEIGSLKLRPGV